MSLMDGGVYDNQGTDSVAIALAEETHADLERADMVAARFVRRYDETPIEADSLGALIISDTPLLNDNIYPAPDQGDKARAGSAGRLTLGHLNMITMTFGVLAILMIFLNADDVGYWVSTIRSEMNAALQQQAPGIWVRFHALVGLAETFLTNMMPIIVGIYLLIVVDRIRSRATAFLLQLPESDPVERAKLDAKREEGGLSRMERRRVARRRWKDLRDLRLSTLKEMMGLRLSSTWALTGTIFLNRIRSLGYSLMENRGDLKNRIIKHEIYGIVDQENRSSKHAPSAQMLAVAQRAASMETALWYDNDDQLKDLVASGQFTMCYNLLEHIDKLRVAGEDRNLKATLYERLAGDWEKLRKNPFRLIDEMERPEGGSGDKDASIERPNVRVAKA